MKSVALMRESIAQPTNEIAALHVMKTHGTAWREAPRPAPQAIVSRTGQLIKAPQMHADVALRW